MRDSDATLILVGKRGLDASRGSRLAIDCAKKLAKPVLVVNLHDRNALETVLTWLEVNEPKILSIGGPRESESPGIYSKAKSFLSELFLQLPRR